MVQTSHRMTCPRHVVVAGLNELPRKKSTLTQRALMLYRHLSKVTATELFNAFLHAYASPLNTKDCRFASETYGCRVQAVVRNFFDSHFLLSLSKSATEDLRLWTGPDLPWLSLSFDPPIAPTPCSSRSSGFTSFKASYRRLKQISSNGGNDAQLLTANEKRLSTGSSILKRRWSQLSSKMSFNSSVVSIREKNPNDDITMQGDS